MANSWSWRRNNILVSVQWQEMKYHLLMNDDVHMLQQPASYEKIDMQWGGRMVIAICFGHALNNVKTYVWVFFRERLYKSYWTTVPWYHIQNSVDSISKQPIRIVILKWFNTVKFDKQAVGVRVRKRRRRQRLYTRRTRDGSLNFYSA